MTVEHAIRFKDKRYDLDRVDYIALRRSTLQMVYKGKLREVRRICPETREYFRAVIRKRMNGPDAVHIDDGTIYRMMRASRVCSYEEVSSTLFRLFFKTDSVAVRFKNPGHLNTAKNAIDHA